MRVLNTLILALYCVVSFCQENFGELRGCLIDSTSVLPMKNLYIRMKSEDTVLNTISNDYGKFEFKRLPAGKYQICILFSELDSSIAEIMVDVNQIKLLGDLIVNSTSKYLFIPTAVNVCTSRRQNQLIVNPFYISTIPRRCIDIVQTIRVTEKVILAGPSQHELQNNEIYVDNIRILSNRKIPKAAIHNIKIYTNGMPAKYGDTFEEIIEIETKNMLNFWKIVY